MLSFLRNTYSRNIYLYGTTKLENVMAGYEEPVKQYTAETYPKVRIDEALEQGFITQKQYDETIAYIK